MKIQEKMRRDWDRRADADPYYWVAATQEADLESYHASAERDSELDGPLPDDTLELVRELLERRPWPA